MLFNSFSFILLFFPIVLGVTLRLKGPGLIRWITLSSIVFYSYAGQTWFVIPMLFTTTLDYFLAIAMEENRFNRKALLIISLVGNLGLLFLFKYAGLFLTTYDYLFNNSTNSGHSIFSTFLALGLPAGISFYTFQTMSYIIDVYRRDCEAERSFWKFAGFVSFFPHLVAGPLTRHNQLIPQLDRIENDGAQPRWKAGIYLFAIGLAKKVLVADRITHFIDPLLIDIHHIGFYESWLASLGYTLYAYFDFSGYSDMAIGLGRLFNIELPQNFNSPYKSLNPSEFWTRWHITLSRWLRDYLYIPLGGNRCSKYRNYLNLVITMGLGGFWHGANWTFIVWGIFQGLLLCCYHQTKTTWDHLYKGIQIFLTVFAFWMGLVVFRSPTLSYCWEWFKSLYGFKGIQPLHITNDILSLVFFNCVALFIIYGFSNASSRKSWDEVSRLEQFGLGLATVVALIFMNSSNKFLYFQF